MFEYFDFTFLFDLYRYLVIEANTYSEMQFNDFLTLFSHIVAHITKCYGGLSIPSFC